jgi:hypothetical protein
MQPVLMHPLVPVRKETGTKGLDGSPFFLLVDWQAQAGDA